jgi:hypothetical protein
VFLIHFFTGSIIGIISGIVLSLVGIVVILAVVVGALAATGGPEPCTPGGGPIELSDANAEAAQLKWDGFEDALDAGVPGSVSFNESELSSRANTYIDEHNAPFDDVLVCVHDGFGEASGTLSLLWFDAKIKVRGNVDLSGDHPNAEIDELEIGNVPDWLGGGIERALNRALDDVFDEIDLEHDYTSTLTPGTATLDGRPAPQP